MAVKPFKGVVDKSVPDSFDPSRMNLDAPNTNLNLKFVHGYRCFDTRNNVFYLDNSNILFHSAALPIKMNLNLRH